MFPVSLNTCDEQWQHGRGQQRPAPQCDSAGTPLSRGRPSLLLCHPQVCLATASDSSRTLLILYYFSFRFSQPKTPGPFLMRESWLRRRSGGEERGHQRDGPRRGCGTGLRQLPGTGGPPQVSGSGMGCRDGACSRPTVPASPRGQAGTGAVASQRSLMGMASTPWRDGAGGPRRSPPLPLKKLAAVLCVTPSGASPRPRGP